MRLLIFATSLLAALSPACAGAQIVSEARIGAALHSIDINGGDPAPEDGVDISGEILFGSPDFFRYLLRPRPMVGGSLNTSGDTDYFYFGFAWEQHLSQRFFVEADLGFARHNGVVEPPPPSDPTRIDIVENHVLFGSRTLFRASLGAGVDLSPRWRAQAFYEHLSNGGILGDGDHNQGLDNVGLRLGYRFGETR